MDMIGPQQIIADCVLVSVISVTISLTTIFKHTILLIFIFLFAKMKSSTSDNVLETLSHFLLKQRLHCNELAQCTHSLIYSGIR